MKTLRIVALSLVAASLPSALSFGVVPPAHGSSRVINSYESKPFSSSSCQQEPLLWMATTDTDHDLKTGKVSWFNAFRGFGFISIDGGEGDVYVHQSNINMDGFRKLEDGAEVQFRIGIDDSERGGGKAYAYDVTSLGSDSGGDVAGDAKSGDVQIAAEVGEVAKEVENSAEVEAGVDPSVPAVEEPAPTPAPVDFADEPIDEGERAFNILVSLGMVDQTPDPDDAEYDSSKDDELAPHTIV